MKIVKQIENLFVAVNVDIVAGRHKLAQNQHQVCLGGKGLTEEAVRRDTMVVMEHLSLLALPSIGRKLSWHFSLDSATMIARLAFTARCSPVGTYPDWRWQKSDQCVASGSVLHA